MSLQKLDIEHAITRKFWPNNNDAPDENLNDKKKGGKEGEWATELWRWKRHRSG